MNDNSNNNDMNFLGFIFTGVETKITNIRVVTKSKGFVSKSVYLNVIVCLSFE